MHPPIAEVPPPAPRRAAKAPPRSLSVMVGLGWLLDGATLLTLSPSLDEIGIPPLWETILASIVTILFSSIPLFLLWRGVRWARWLNIVLAVLGLMVTVAFWGDTAPDQTPLGQIVGWLYIPYSLGLLIFLWTPAMRRHFGAPAGAEAK